MSVNIRYPNITALSEKEQLAQIKSYLHQLVEQLNYALPSIGSGNVSVQAQSSQQVQGEEISYYELRSLIIQQLQEMDTMFEQLSQKMQSDYVSDAELPQAINTALTQAKDSGEFDGPQGPQGEQGIKGEPGEDGYSPVVTVEEILNGHRVTITDATSTQSFDVMNGTIGAPSGLRFKLDDGTILY